MDSICCLCLTETEASLQDIPSEESHNERVWKIFGVQLISTGDYPTAACHECLVSLELCWNFRQQVLNSFACLNIIGTADRYEMPILKLEAPDVIGESVVSDLEGPLNNQDESMHEDTLDESTIFVDDTEILDQEELSDPDCKNICKLCSKMFPTAHRLRVHESSHSKEQPFSCPECPIRFKTERNAKNHYLTIHSQDRPLSCDKCNKKFARSTDLKKHKKSIHAEKPFRCSVCGRSFTNEVALDKHQEQHLVKTLYKCAVCSICFRTQAKLNEHIDTHTNDTADGGQTDPTNANNQCDICNKCFVSRSALLNHKVTHTEDRPFQCQHCDLNFKVRSTLLAHEKVVHLKMLPHQCPICSKGHSRKSNLARHMKAHSKLETARPSFVILEKAGDEEDTEHENHADWRCHHCDQSLGSQQKLRDHIRTAHLQKQNYCKDCHELFLSKSEFEDHRMKVHGDKM